MTKLNWDRLDEYLPVRAWSEHRWSQEPATAKQLQFLADLGETVPPKSKWDAHVRIQELLRARQSGSDD